MKRYIKSATIIDDPVLRKIKKSIEDYVEEYYDFLKSIGYEEEYPKPDCIIELDNSSYKKLYKISIEFYKIREQDGPSIWNKLDNIVNNAYPNYEIYQLFYRLKDTNKFYGYIKEGKNKSTGYNGTSYDSIEKIIKAANHVSDSEYYYWLDEQLSDYCDAMDWDWDNFPSEDIKFLNKNPEWKQYIQDNIM